MAMLLYDTGLLTLTDGSTAWATDAHYAILVNGYTFSRAHDDYQDASPNELADPDYAPLALASKTATLVANAVRFNCDNLNFGADVSIGPADGVIIVKGTAATPQATDPLICYSALADLESVDNNFVLNTPDGLFDIGQTQV